MTTLPGQFITRHVMNLAHPTYALGPCAECAKTDLYKVGHHGSRNATPRELLWEAFDKRGGGKNSASPPCRNGRFTDT
jgi:hypothetical protein